MAARQESPAPDAAGIKFYGGYQVYSDSGIDLTLLRENLSRTVEQRFDDNGRAIPLLEALRSSRRPRRAGVADGDRRPAMLDVAAILRQLNDHQVEYVLIGGLAMIAHGSAYNTKVADICYGRSSANLAAVATAFAPLHPYLRGAPAGLPFRFDALTIQASLNFTLTTDLGDIDLLGEVSGVGTYVQVLAQSEERDLYGLKVRVLSLAGLIAAKRAANRPKDRYIWSARWSSLPSPRTARWQR
jgi:hypothetical protein